jgi:hypothetical protein
VKGKVLGCFLGDWWPQLKLGVARATAAFCHGTGARCAAFCRKIAPCRARPTGNKRRIATYFPQNRPPGVRFRAVSAALLLLLRRKGLGTRD